MRQYPLHRQLAKDARMRHGIILMRTRIFVFLGMACAGALAAQTAAPDPAVPVPVFHDTNPSDVFASAKKVVPDETRTPAQLNALLKTYVGHWQGESRMSALGVPKVIHYPVDMVCTMADENGLPVLSTVTTFTDGQEKIVEKQRMWVQGGRIVAEIIAGSETLRLAGHTRDNSLVWTALDTTKTPLDFYQTETIDLTIIGGKMHVEGFEVQYTSQGSAMICNTADLTLMR
jgi:hypothetical protein